MSVMTNSQSRSPTDNVSSSFRALNAGCVDASPVTVRAETAAYSVSASQCEAGRESQAARLHIERDVGVTLVLHLISADITRHS